MRERCAIGGVGSETMKVGVGYSENPDSAEAGIRVAREALAQSGADRCDIVLLFSTARHDAQALRDAVASVVGADVPIVGGWSVGAISSEHFGYAGDQVVLAVLTLGNVSCDLLVEGDLACGEYPVGQRLGRRLAALGANRNSPVLLFYDSADHSGSSPHLILATPLIDGIENGLGFLPNLVGCGLMGDMIAQPTLQWTGEGIGECKALALLFSGGIRLDSIVMHGCKPATGYHTVTAADGATILEIDGVPALDFVRSIMGESIPAEDYGLFLTFGMNKGDKWGPFDEESYVNRLCLSVDEARNGLTMFEADMVTGTEFQIMHRSIDMDYIAPRVERCFARLGGRKPLFALYINCTGRAAGYAGIDSEDAVAIQKAIAGRAPLLGLYSGVEIGQIMGRARALDWTGVFCLLSVPS